MNETILKAIDGIEHSYRCPTTTVEEAAIILAANTPEQYFVLGALMASCHQAGMPFKEHSTFISENEVTLTIPVKWLLAGCLIKS